MTTSRLLAALIAFVALTVVPDTATAQAKHDCSYCHNLHGGSFQALGVRDLQVDLCQWCHDPDGGQGATIDGKTIPKQGRNAEVLSGFADHVGVRSSDSWQPSCWDCHNHEGEADSTTTSSWTNLKMIQATITDPLNGARPVIFTQWSGDSSFADTNADSAFVGVCETCHTETQRHQNAPNFHVAAELPPGAERRHNGAADCTGCHTHDSGFQGLGGGCAGCHASAQSGTNSRRPVSPEFDRTTHHIDWAAAGEASSADIIDDDCLVCHVQEDGHPGEGTSGTGHNVALRHGDDGSTIVLTGDPNTSSAAAQQLTPFCLSCHVDGEDSTGDPNPFSDNIDIPILEGGAVDSVFWANTSGHGLGQISCYGTGAFGCHASGHGSEKNTLLGLQPALSPDSGSTPGYYQEEGFCFNCHSATGTASSDLLTAFEMPINWVGVGDGAGWADNENINDRHDVQLQAQTRSGAAIECTSCHNPHTATPDLPFILDPDPDDGHIVAQAASSPPGTDATGQSVNGWYWFNTKTRARNPNEWFSFYQSADTLSEFCLDCHDGSFPTSRGVQDHTWPAGGMNDFLQSWHFEDMGADTANGFTERTENNMNTAGHWSEGDMMPCWSCHSPHPQVHTVGAVTTTTLFSTWGNPRDKPTVPAGEGPWRHRESGVLLPEWQEGTGGFDYGLIENTTNNSLTDGSSWCSTCHNGMPGKNNCFSCHRHNDSNDRF